MSRALLIVVLVLGIAGSVAAAGPNDNWIIYLKAADSSGNNGLAASCLYGTKVGATDFPVETTNDSSNLAGTAGTSAVLGAFDLGLGNYNNGYYKDLRQSYDPVSHPLSVWNLRLYVQSNWSGGDLYLTGWNQTGTYALNGTIQMALKVVSDPTGTYAAGTTLCTFGNGFHGTSANPEFTAVFRNLAPVKGSGYISLQLVQATQTAAVPEPGSLLSLTSLLGACTGFGFLRRRRK